MKGFALGLTLKERRKATQKSPIESQITILTSPILGKHSDKTASAVPLGAVMVKTLKPKHTFYDKDLVIIFPGSRVLKSGLNIVQMYDNVVISKLQTKLNEIT